MSGPIRRQMGPAKARLQAMVAEATGLDLNMRLDPNLNLQTLDDLEERIGNVHCRLAKQLTRTEAYDTAWQEILEKMDEENVEDEQELYNNMADGENGFIEILNDAQDTVALMERRLNVISERRNRLQNAIPVPNNDHQQIQVPIQPQPQLQHSKLPELTLPRFSGEIREWPEFWDGFRSSIHDRVDLPNVKKLAYLKGTLSGRAAEIIKGVSTTDANYQVALDLLERNFGNREVQLNALYTDWWNLQPASSNLMELKCLLNSTERILRQLTQLNDDISQFSSTLDWFRRKLPQNVKIELERNKEAVPNWNLENLLEALHKYLDTRLDGSETKTATKAALKVNLGNSYKSFEPRKDFCQAQKYGHSSAEVLLANKEKVMTRKCAFCSGNHFNDQCSEYATKNDRFEKAKVDKKCFVCLRNDHQVKQCPYREGRTCVYCKKFGHNRALCSEKFGATTQSAEQKTKGANEFLKVHENVCVSKNSNFLSSGQYTMLLTATVMCRRPSSSRILPCRLIFDSGSHLSYIRHALAEKLNLEPNSSQQLSVSTFACDAPKELQSYNTNVEIFLKDGSTKLISVNGISKLTGQLNREMLCQADLAVLKEISVEKLADVFPNRHDSFCPDILVGNDFFWDIVRSGEVRTLPSGLRLIPSSVGLLIGGHTANILQQSLSKMSVQPCFISTLSRTAETFGSVVDKVIQNSGNPNMSEFWSLESIGIIDSPGKDEDDTVLTEFESKLVLENGRYQVCWPWKDKVPDLKSNFGLALGRMRSLTKRLHTDNELLKKYSDIIEDQSQKGITEVVDEKVSEDPNEKRLLHYLPHHPVITPQKATTKVRIVYDASAKITPNHKSLNDCLYSGPNLIPDLCGILLRFRLPKIVMISDVEKAFLQVGLQMPDRDVTRFLWYKEPTNAWIGPNLENLAIYRFCRIPFGVSSSPFLLEAVIKHHLKALNSELALEIDQNLYVDNVMISANSPDEGYLKHTEAKSIFSDISMNLREWSTNSAELNDKISEPDKAKGNEIKLLGIKWNLVDDHLKIEVPEIVNAEQVLTRRKLLSMVSSIFDPLGFWTPTTLLAKSFFQDLWIEGFGWDAVLPEAVQSSWKNIVKCLQGIHGNVVPRRVLHDDYKKIQFVVFSDASRKTYGAAIYAVAQSPQKIASTLVFSKMRLKPVKTSVKKQKQEISIPRLELLGVLVGIRALKLVREQTKTDEMSIFYTDSQCVLHWLASEKTQTTFVKNRIQEIKKVPNVQFRYVSTAENPADLLTKGESAENLSQNKLWWNGPKWLTENEQSWPNLSCTNRTSELMSEPRKLPVNCEIVHTDQKRTPLGINEDKFSSLGKLLRVTACCLVFLKLKCPKNAVKIPTLKNIDTGSKITINNLSIAENMWNKFLQKKHFEDFFRHTEQSKSSVSQQLGVFTDPKGILRCAGRFQNTPGFSWKNFPVLLPRKEHYTKLIIQETHKRVMHGMVNRTLAELRKRYWVTQGRSEVKTVIRKCQLCHKYNSGPFKLPDFPPYPRERLECSPPFSYVGLDYFGPILVKSNEQLCKKWVCLFTCLVTRSVHLELVSDLSGSEFLASFNRFCSRRGCPTKIISDNAKQFKLADSLITRALENLNKNYDVLAKLASTQVSWKFIPEFSPWQGGIYERMVGTVKSALRKALGRRLLNTEQLQTVLCEIECAVNGRPLTYLSAEFPERMTLSPSDFLNPGKNNIVPEYFTIDQYDEDYNPSNKTSSAQKLETLWKKQLIVLQNFWRIWKEDYLNMLRERVDFQHPQKKVQEKRQPEIDEVVIIKNEMMPRGLWKLGRILEANESQDSEIRSAKIQLPNGNIITRPINHLYPLEVTPFENISSSDLNTEKIKPQISFKTAVKHLTTFVCGNVAKR